MTVSSPEVLSCLYVAALPDEFAGCLSCHRSQMSIYMAECKYEWSRSLHPLQQATGELSYTGRSGGAPHHP